MTKMGVQFHGTPSEIIEFAEECAKEMSLYTVAMNSFPEFTIDLLDERDVVSYAYHHPIDDICFSLTEADVDVNRRWDFIKKNPDCLSLQIGKIRDGKLTESFLSAETNDPDLLKQWRRIARKLKKLTITGGWVINPLAKTKGFYKDIRYTKAAKELYEAGVIIKPSGGNYYVLNSNPNEIPV